MNNPNRIKTTLILGIMLLGLPGRTGAGAEPAGAALKVLTYNIWGVFNAKQRDFRVEKIPEAIFALNPDLVCLEECFRRKDLNTIQNGLRRLGYPLETVYRKELDYGSGVVILSRFPAELLEFDAYRIKGAPHSYERKAGRGVAHARIHSPAGPVDFFCTHAMPRMNLIFDEQGNYLDADPKQDDRLLQMVELSRIVERRRDPDAAGVIVAGDINVSPEMLEYQLLLPAGGFRSSFSVLHPQENPPTFTRQGNEFSSVEAGRLDHILFRNYPGAVGNRLEPRESRVVMTELAPCPRLGRSVPLSDHFGIFTGFALRDPDQVAPDPEPPAAKPLREPGFYLPAIASGTLELTPETRAAWETLARAALEDAIARGRRQSPLIRPAAEILAGWKASEGRQRIQLNAEQKKALRDFLGRSTLSQGEVE